MLAQPCTHYCLQMEPACLVSGQLTIYVHGGVLQESERVMSTVLSVQPRTSHTAGAVSNDDMVASVAQDILANLPAPLSREDASIARDPFAALPTGG